MTTEYEPAAMEQQIEQEEAEEVCSNTERFENKVEELNTISLASVLLFGFSVSLWIDFDESLFEDNIALALVFTLSGLCTIICSALATGISICSIICYRRLLFKCGDVSERISHKNLMKYKTNMRRVHEMLRYMVYASVFGLLVLLGAYSHVKWMQVFDGAAVAALYTVCYGMLILAVLLLIGVYRVIRAHYRDALKDD